MSFKKIPLFSKGLINFTISFISLFLRVVSEVLPVTYTLLNFSVCLSRKYSPKLVPISVYFLPTVDKRFPKIGMSQVAPPDCIIILDNRRRTIIFISAEEHFQKLSKTCESVSNNLISSREFPIKFDE